MPAPVADSRQRGRDGVAGRIVAAIPLRDCPLHDRADTLANTAGGHGLFSPYRQQDRHHVGCGDGVHRLTREARKSVLAQRRGPLTGGLAAIAPCRLVDFDYGPGGFLENRDVRSPLQRQRIASRTGQLAVRESRLPGFGQRDQRIAA